MMIVKMMMMMMMMMMIIIIIIIINPASPDIDSVCAGEEVHKAYRQTSILETTLRLDEVSCFH